MQALLSRFSELEVAAASMQGDKTELEEQVTKLWPSKHCLRRIQTVPMKLPAAPVCMWQIRVSSRLWKAVCAQSPVK